MKQLVKIFAATIAACAVLFSCSNESPVQKIVDFAETLGQTYESFADTDWSNAIATYSSIKDALAGYECNEAEQAQVAEADAKIVDIFAAAKAALSEEAKSVLEHAGIPAEALEVEIEDEPIDLEALATEFAAEAETAAKELNVEVAKAIPFAAVEEKPSFDGGDANKFSKWVSKHIEYPASAQENEIEGRVVLSFDVNEEGAVENVKVLKGVDEALDAEAVRVVSSSPAWTPGKQNGNAVKVNYTFPVNFTLR